MMSMLKRWCGSIIVRDRFIRGANRETWLKLLSTVSSKHAFAIFSTVANLNNVLTVPGAVGLALDWLTPNLYIAVRPTAGLLGYVAVLPLKRSMYILRSASAPVVIGTFALDPVSVAVYPGRGWVASSSFASKVVYSKTLFTARPICQYHCLLTALWWWLIKTSASHRRRSWRLTWTDTTRKTSSLSTNDKYIVSSSITSLKLFTGPNRADCTGAELKWNRWMAVKSA